MLTLSRATGRKLKSDGWPFDCQFPRDCMPKLENALVNLTYWISVTVSLLNWLFCHTIYGMLGVAVLVYLLFRDLRKTFPRVPEPALVAGLVFLVGVGTLPSIPRYQFHNEMLKLTLQTDDRARAGQALSRVASTSR